LECNIVPVNKLGSPGMNHTAQYTRQVRTVYHCSLVCNPEEERVEEEKEVLVSTLISFE
jgi:hypothetical protein